MRPLELSEEGTATPGVIGLDHPASTDPAIVGGKAAALATARRAALPVLDGFVVSTGAAAAWRDAGVPPPSLREELERAWQRLGAGGAALVVRSSSPHEDTQTSSMAGQFRSVLDVTGWDGLLDAVRQVIDSAHGGPMAVLVQRHVRPAWGGVLFGADPVTGRRDRLVVAVVPGGPDQLVSGAVSGGQFALSSHGRVLDSTGDVPGRMLSRRVRRSLARLAAATAQLFGAPQDVEWAVEGDGRLLLLQSRPITTVGHEPDDVRGPVLGPGPLAETFPVGLAPLEEDLWIPPVREGLRRALGLVGAAPARRLRRSAVVVTINGRPAVDLDLLGLSPVRRPVWTRLDPRPPARRLLAAWRVGRLRAALPALAGDLLQDVDEQLRAVPRPDALPAAEIVRLLERSGGVLRSLHGYEVLAGQLLSTATQAPTAASRALEVLAAARAERREVTDEELVAEHPVLLSLLPPAVRAEVALPPAPVRSPRHRPGDGDGDDRGAHGHPNDPDHRRGRRDRRDRRGGDDPAATVREALRLRTRWVQELTARAALALGHQLVARGVLAEATDVRALRLADLRAAVAGDPEALAALAAVATRTGGAPPADADPAGGGDRPVDTPLPRAFRQAGDVIVPVAAAGEGRAGRGAGGGRGMGKVRHRMGTGPPPPGTVLVVDTLDPGLAPWLPDLAGLVAETGSVLSHLAILAREYGVPTVVDLPGARQRYPEGTWVAVDGASGEVSAVQSEEWTAA